MLDMFAGSGTTLEAAAAEGFEAVGIELDEGYCANAKTRLEAAHQETHEEEKQHVQV